MTLFLIAMAGLFSATGSTLFAFLLGRETMKERSDKGTLYSALSLICFGVLIVCISSLSTFGQQLVG